MSRLGFGLLLLLLVACMQEPGEDVTTPPTAEQPAPPLPQENQETETPRVGSEPWQVVVLDPLARPLSCSCVPGLGQRQYGLLALHLSGKLGDELKPVFEGSLMRAEHLLGGEPAMVIGPKSLVDHDLDRMGWDLHPRLRLSDRIGQWQTHGQIVVRKEGPVRSLADLQGKTLFLGPSEDDETHAAIKAALDAAGLTGSVTLKHGKSIEEGLFAIEDGEADAAAIAEHTLPLLEGCGKAPKDSLRVLTRVGPVAGVTVYLHADLPAPVAELLVQEMLAGNQQQVLLTALESQAGFATIKPSDDANDDRPTGP